MYTEAMIWGAYDKGSAWDPKGSICYFTPHKIEDEELGEIHSLIPRTSQMWSWPKKKDKYKHLFGLFSGTYADWMELNYFLSEAESSNETTKKIGSLVLKMFRPLFIDGVNREIGWPIYEADVSLDIDYTPTLYVTVRREGIRRRACESEAHFTLLKEFAKLYDGLLENMILPPRA
jgi:hypothetical protein